MLRQFNYTKILGRQKGKYVRDIKKKQRYHYSDKCEHWKALMFDFNFNKEVQDKVILQKNLSYFIKLGMEECRDYQKL